MIEKRGDWIKLSSRVVHKNSYYSVREDTVIKPDGSKGFYNVVQGIAAVFIIVIDENNDIYLVGLHRYPNNIYSIEVPSGSTDNQDPLVAAKRELQEETGLTASDWKYLGILHPANGFLDINHYIFIAKGLKHTHLNHQAEEGISKIYKVQFKQVLNMIKNGEITDSDTVSALTLAAIELKLI